MYGNVFQTDFSLKYELLLSVKSTFENINTSYIPLPIHDCYLLLYTSTLNISQVMVSNQISMLLKKGNTLSLKNVSFNHGHSIQNWMIIVASVLVAKEEQILVQPQDDHFGNWGICLQYTF